MSYAATPYLSSNGMKESEEKPERYRYFDNEPHNVMDHMNGFFRPPEQKRNSMRTWRRESGNLRPTPCKDPESA